MTVSTLATSMNRLESIKSKKYLYNQTKIAEAESLAAEALRMANEARLAAARLAEVKKTLSTYSTKLETVEQTVEKENKPKSFVLGKERESVDAPIKDPTRQNDPLKKESVNKTEDIKLERGRETLVKKKSIAGEKSEEQPVKEEPIAEKKFEEPPVKEEPIAEKKDEEPPVKEASIQEERNKKESFKEEVNEDLMKKKEPVEINPFKETEAVKNLTFKSESQPEKQLNNANKLTEKQRQDCVVSRHLVGNGVVKVVETGNQKAVGRVPVLNEKQQTSEDNSSSIEKITSNPVEHIKRISENIVNPSEMNIGSNVEPALTVTEQNENDEVEKDIIEDFLDSLGVDKICGVDDETLGLNSRPVSSSPSASFPPEQKSSSSTTITHVEQKKSPLNGAEIVQSASLKTNPRGASMQGKEKIFASKTYSSYNDPFGVDHDDFIFCGQLADLCEPPGLNDYEYEYEYASPPQQEIRLR